MIRLELRCTPSSGRTDLAWLADLTGSLDEICDFLLRTEIADQVGRDRPLRPDELARVVDGQAIEQGSPIVHVRDGSTIIQLAAQLVDSTIPVQVLASVALLFKKGPEVAAWPGHVKKAWYEARAEAEQGRHAYQRITVGSTVEIVEDDVGRATTRPNEPTQERSRRGGPDNADLPHGVTQAPPLDG